MNTTDKLMDKINSTRFILASSCLIVVILNSPVFMDLKIPEGVLTTVAYGVIAYIAAQTWKDVQGMTTDNNNNKTKSEEKDKSSDDNLEA